MIELPEALTLANQLNNTIKGKKISNVIAMQSPHKFAWFNGDPHKYKDMLLGKIVDSANSCGGLVEIKVENEALLFGDGVGLKFHKNKDAYPSKHQLLIEFSDNSALSASIQMYGGIWCFHYGELDYPYYNIAKNKPSPLVKKFDKQYFDSMISTDNVQKLSLKAFLATEQRIPGLGNGVLQDILYNARLNPRKKVNTLGNAEQLSLFNSIKETLLEMTEKGGRDVEKDLFGNPGGYKTKAGKNTANQPCLICGIPIIKENYMGGSIYYCKSCQVL